jgi:hypothetical protein
MPDVMNEMHGPHCNGKYTHCICNECHGRPVEAYNYAKDAKNECGHHCLGHYCNELIGPEPTEGEPDTRLPCQGRLSENSNVHCRCKDCHNIPDFDVHRKDETISFEPIEN